MRGLRRTRGTATGRSGARRGPLGLGEIALGHPFGRLDAGRVAQIPLGVERGLRARAGGRHGLAVRVVDEVAGGEDPGTLRARRATLGDDVALVVDVDLPGDELRLR